jgi:hypothetical protein
MKNKTKKKKNEKENAYKWEHLAVSKKKTVTQKTNLRLVIEALGR